MNSLLSDIRYTFRTLAKNPGFAAVAILTLALGIGANSAIFSVVNGVVLRPLAYRDSERLVFITSQFPGLGFDQFWMSAPEYLELQERSSSFSHMGAYVTGAVSVSSGDQPMRVTAAFHSAELFATLDVPAALGRVFNSEEDLPGGEPVVVLSDGLWRTAFAGDRSLVGRTLEVDGVQRTVVGVMPPGFDINDSGVEAFIPLGLDPANPGSRGGHYLYLVGRLAEGATLQQAEAELEPILSQWPQTNPGQHTPNESTHRVAFEDLKEQVVGDVRPTLMMLLGAVGFVLLIACANVANLLLAKAESRQREIAVRTALGAGVGRLLRQFVTESVALSLIGGTVGTLLAHWGVKALLAASPGSIPRVAEIGLDMQVLGFTLAVSVVTGVLFGLAPMLHLSAANLGMALREGGQRATAGSARLKLRRLLVVSEVALAVVLVVGSGLMLRSFAALQQVNPGFEPRGLLTFRLFLPQANYPQFEDQLSFFDRATQRLSSMPGVESAAAMSGLPPIRRINANTMVFEGLEETPEGPPHNVDYWQFVSTNYFETMKIDLVDGRLFTTSDAIPDAPVTVVNETMAKVFWPDRNPIGQRLRPAWNDPVPWFTVVGIVKDVKQGGLGQETGTEMYFHLPEASAVGSFPRTMNVVMRTTLPPPALASAARGEVASMDASLPLANLQSMEGVFSGSVAQPRFLMLLLGVFAAVALSLAAVGTYGVMSYSVAERSKEIGTRMALGASASSVLTMVLKQGMTLAGTGLALGVLGAIGLTRMMSSLLFEVSATDVTTFVTAPLVLGVVAAVACFVPARRATKVNPIEVLKAE